MLSAKTVIPECCVDSCLFNVLLNFKKEGVNHTKGNSTVTKKIEEKFGNLFCLGIIDKDKQPLKFLEQCDQIEIVGYEDYFLLYKRKDYYHYIIRIVPEIEPWILNVCDKLNLKLFDFGINANNVQELAKISKSVTAKDDYRFKLLFKTIVKVAEEKEFKPILELIRITKLILQKNYNLDIKELINGRNA